VRSGRFAAGLLAVVLSACAYGNNVLTLEVGDCFNESGPPHEDVGDVTDVPIVGCEDAHDNEIYAAYEIAGKDFPGSDALYSSADDFCLEEFEPFVGAPYETSQLNFGWIVPTSETWDIGDRVVLCFVYRADLAKSTGTWEGSGF
jgi:hypothetical protein